MEWSSTAAMGQVGLVWSQKGNNTIVSLFLLFSTAAMQCNVMETAATTAESCMRGVGQRRVGAVGAALPWKLQKVLHYTQASERASNT